MKFVRTWLMEREIAARLRQRRAARLARSQAAQIGISRQWKRRADKCREVFQ